MSPFLRNFIDIRKDKKKKKHIRELQTIQEHLQKELYFWDTKFIEEKELIKSLRYYISSLWDEVEDAKDALFSEIDYQSFSMECEMVVKMQAQIEFAKEKCQQLIKRIENCKMQQSAMRKQLNEMNLRIEENNKYKIDLLQRKEKADRIVLYRRNRIAQQQLNNNDNTSSQLNIVISPTDSFL
ncbi:unnamed protein product [Cercopithifilaria johnstoni]|uniref:Uncharacterized protein n=1 Tax=Cercopithifilaria johnstoni TaxID=2874296 RepID=A0A8J2LSN3_9BILA|nr:unnamed protein product [Cercopithifilaria johnstoni]